MTTKLTHESRHAISRAKLFLEKAKSCSSDQQVDFEAFLEATIVFARAAVHRLKSKYEHHPQWKGWWDSLLDDPAIRFFRTERDWILKQASPKVGQKIFMAGTIDGDQAGYVPIAASEFYYYEDPQTPATDTVERHLAALERRLSEAEQRFASTSDLV
jgi:hypothetical protein